MIFIGGTIIGGFITSTYLSDETPVILNNHTIQALESWNIVQSEIGLIPAEIFVIIYYHEVNCGKPFFQTRHTFWESMDRSIVRYLIGGIIFGLGWSLIGACPGSIFILIGNGFSIFIVVLLSALLGTFTYGILRNKQPH